MKPLEVCPTSGGQFKSGAIQSFDPVGVAARSVAECLNLQLRGLADAPLRALAQRIVSGHLDPRPGARFSDLESRAIVPDVVVRKVPGTWKAALNGSALPRVHLHQSYAALFEQHRQSGDIAMKACLDQARWTVQNATRRVSTILDIASAIVARQTLFLDYGQQRRFNHRKMLIDKNTDFRGRQLASTRRTPAAC